jgi:muramidase (phage lysozyme)
MNPGPHYLKSITMTCICFLITLSCQVAFATPKPRHHQPKVNRTKRIPREDLVERYSLNKRVKESNGPQVRRNLQALLPRQDVKKFLLAIKKAEGGKPNIMVGGCRARTLRQHPAQTLPKRCRYWLRFNGRRTFSTASGNYQLTFSNWKRIAPFLGLRSFSENNQALAALELVRRGGGAAESQTPRGLSLKRRIQTGFVHLLKGNLKTALCLATYDWASSSCSPLPAGYKVNYAHLVNTSRPKSKSAKLRYRRIRR